MKLLPNHKLNPEQLAALQMVEKILNTTDFEAWFVRARFTELAPGMTGIGMLENSFRNQHYRFIWKIVKRPFWKFWTKEPGVTEGFTIKTYEQAFNKMTLAERAGYLAHEMMHIMGFVHSNAKSLSRSKTVPYQVGDYVEKAVAHYVKANE
jgi:hypothetical protein